MREDSFSIEEVTDPDEITRFRIQNERARRNSDWLQTHWPDLIPQARGRFLAVAGEEAFLGDTAELAWALAKGAHPDDEGTLIQYVLPGQGPRFDVIFSRRRKEILLLAPNHQYHVTKS
jgi:hypothetical protein